MKKLGLVRILFIVILNLVANSELYSQDCFELFYKKGIGFYENLAFDKAIKQFKASKICEDFPRENDIDLWIEKSRVGYIEKLTKARNEAEENLERAQKLINAFYFYDNKYALVIKNGIYYFIDKDGNRLRKFGTWRNAEQFDQFGFAKVFEIKADTVFKFDRATFDEEKLISNKQEINYLIDTLGSRYKLAIDINKIDTTMEAIRFSNNVFVNLDTIKFERSKLKIIILHGNTIRSIPSEMFENEYVEKV